MTHGAATPNPPTIPFAAAIGAARTSTWGVDTKTGASGEPNAQAAIPIAFILNSTTVMTQNGMTGVRVIWTSPLPFSATAQVWFVAYNTKNQVVFLSFVQFLFAANESHAVFQGFSSALPSGTYVVQLFVFSPNGAALSATFQVTISF